MSKLGRYFGEVMVAAFNGQCPDENGQLHFHQWAAETHGRYDRRDRDDRIIRYYRCKRCDTTSE